MVGAVAVGQGVVGSRSGDGDGIRSDWEFDRDLLHAEVDVIPRAGDATGGVVQVRLGHPVPDPRELEPGLQGSVRGVRSGDREGHRIPLGHPVLVAGDGHRGLEPVVVVDGEGVGVGPAGSIVRAVHHSDRQLADVLGRGVVFGRDGDDDVFAALGERCGLRQ